ncbi:N-6 DNA methylase [Agrococcus jejuensis]|uniref:N-6 DNA Methylase n=1 Tax=Agrococcus jejuensis TaxID=399736 RepID=A0A1G8DXI8_9MICO|nr:N-6 DNA methylase [Agrococcus jejuensis]SDH62397.1 N-6 DNA Methylase [Agrococcus jejuensis]
MLPDRPLPGVLDLPSERKARGAFFTPVSVTRHLAEWALVDASDRVLEPSAGEAAFLAAAVDRLKELGADKPLVDGVEIHGPSAESARLIVGEAGGEAAIRVSDFFLVEAQARFDAVIGNPPFIRYQDWTGDQRDRARFAALDQGVALTGLASSWAAFVVHAAGFLKPGGRLGLVLPAELLSVNYAAPVRRFLLERFAHVELVVFDEQIFSDAEADTVLVKASGWGLRGTGAATLRQTRNAESLSSLDVGTSWLPLDTGDRWPALQLSDTTLRAVGNARGDGSFTPLSTWGETSLGAVTGGNRFFALSPERVRELAIPRRDLLRVSPPGSTHLRSLALTRDAISRLGRNGESTWLLYPSSNPAKATMEYIAQGHATGVDQAYKCRVRSPWWRVPVLAAPDLFLTYMNAATVQLATNEVEARHLNSVHGVYLKPEVRDLGRELLSVAALNSFTTLSAESVGRSYGGGILKMEPREADGWMVPSPEAISTRRDDLLAIRPTVRRLLQQKKLNQAVRLVDSVLLSAMTSSELESVRNDQAKLADRRVARGRSGRKLRRQP